MFFRNNLLKAIFCVPSFMVGTSNLANAMQAPNCATVYTNYCKYCVTDFDEDRCDNAATEWTNYCFAEYGSPDCDKPFVAKTTTAMPEVGMLKKYFGPGASGDILHSSDKDSFVRFITAFDQNIQDYKSQSHHNLKSDLTFVRQTLDILGEIVKLTNRLTKPGSKELVFGDQSYNVSKYINELLYPIYLEIYQRHFHTFYSLRMSIDPSELASLMMHDIDLLAVVEEEKAPIREVIKCSLMIEKSMVKGGKKGIFSFTPGGYEFPLAALFFDAWQLAKFNGQETTVFSSLFFEETCGHGTGIRAFLFIFAPQLRAALEKLALSSTK